MMSEHLVTINTGSILLGWTDLVTALEELAEQIPGVDIRITHIKRLEAIAEVLEAKFMECQEQKRNAKINSSA